MQKVWLYPDQVPGTIPADKQAEFQESGHVRNVHYPDMDVYLPEGGRAAGCGVVVCPGGGYHIQAANHEGMQIARLLNCMGAAAFVLRYRLPPDYRHPVPMQDAQRAIRVVRAHGEKWLVKPNRIGILGFSAGGHLAATATTKFDAGNPNAKDPVERVSCRPDFSILGYPVMTFVQDYCHEGSRANLLGPALNDQSKRELSPELNVTADTPPTFLFHAVDDKVVDPRNSFDFVMACREKGVPVELHLFQAGAHGFGMGKLGTTQSQWPDLLKNWLISRGMLAIV